MRTVSIFTCPSLCPIMELPDTDIGAPRAFDIRGGCGPQTRMKVVVTVSRLGAVLFIGLVIFTLAGGKPAIAADSGHPVMPAPLQGELDLRGVQIQDGSETISLHGEWEFYWNQLLTPADFRNGPFAASYLSVPSSWKNENVAGDSTSRYGYGTYRLQMHLPLTDIGEGKSLFLKSIGSAYRLWIDGREYPGLGQVGRNSREEVVKAHINLVFFQPVRQDTEIVIQVSNFSFREGGINGEVTYGDTSALVPRVLKALLYDMFVIGGFLMIGLYHLVVFVMRRRDISALLVGVLTLGVSSRTLFINGYLSSLLLGIHNWELLVKLEYASELAAFVAAVLLMKRLYAQEVHRYMTGFSVILALGLLLYVLATPARIFTETMLLQTALKGIILLYYFFYIGMKAYVHKREGALIHMIAALFIIFALINDALYYARMIRTVELLSYSIVPFILAQAIIVSYRYTRISNRNDMLVEELEKTNLTLEQKVEERTQSLYEANGLRTKLLVNIAHDLGTPLVGIQTYIQLMVEGKVQVDQGAMTQQLLNKAAYMQRLIHDLFELSKLESKEMILHFERWRVNDWFQTMFEMFQSDLAQQSFTLRLGRRETIPDQVTVRMDRMRIIQVLQNYFDNAVKFSRGFGNEIMLSGYVQASQGETGAELVVEITDYGTGMTKEEQAYVFHRFYKRRERNEEGSGLGLAIVKEIVEQHNGEVGVRSEKGAGSTFFFKLPVQLAE